MKNIFILGISHDVQPTDGGCSSSLTQQFQAYIKGFIELDRIDFVGEEWEPSSTIRTVAQELAKHRIHWEPIDLSSEEKAQKGFPQVVNCFYDDPADGDYRTQIIVCGFQSYIDDFSLVSIEPRVAQEDIRDQHMFDRVIESSKDYANILVLCGFIHLTQLAKKFRDAGHLVKECDSWIEVRYGKEHSRVRFPR